MLIKKWMTRSVITVAKEDYMLDAILLLKPGLTHLLKKLPDVLFLLEYSCQPKYWIIKLKFH